MYSKSNSSINSSIKIFAKIFFSKKSRENFPYVQFYAETSSNILEFLKNYSKGIPHHLRVPIREREYHRFLGNGGRSGMEGGKRRHCGEDYEEAEQKEGI
jgi:hypothetical protein